MIDLALDDPPVSGAAVRPLIMGMLAQHEAGIADRFAPYEPASAVAALHLALRMIEEMINLPQFGAFDPAEKAMLRALPITPIAAGDLNSVLAARNLIIPRHAEPTGTRFGRTMVHLADVMNNYRQNRFEIGAGFSLATVGDAMIFLQSRRRHLVTLFYGAPARCQGTQPLDVAMAFLLLFMVAQHSCTTITELHQNLVATYLFPDFAMQPTVRGYSASHRFEPLEADYLEPERLSLLTLVAERGVEIASTHQEHVPADKIFSAAELRNTVRALRAAYAAYGVDDDAWAALSLLVVAFSRRCRDDYVIRIGRAAFDALLAAQDAIAPDRLEALLVHSPGSFAADANAYQPFIVMGDELISNVNLLGRFLYVFKNVHLASRKRFQIHAGFIFEDSVERALAALGFTITGIKRINHKEFDVVTLAGDHIVNFQCKNSSIDLARLDHEPERFARANRRLVRYFQRALRKEVDRENLLLEKLGRSRIQHFVISRFPVLTEDVAIINFNQLDQRASAIFACCVGAVSAAAAAGQADGS
jgi:hypothetical protein